MARCRKRGIERTRRVARPTAKGVGLISEDGQLCGSDQDMPCCQSLQSLRQGEWVKVTHEAIHDIKLGVMNIQFYPYRSAQDARLTVHRLVGTAPIFVFHKKHIPMLEKYTEHDSFAYVVDCLVHRFSRRGNLQGDHQTL